MNKDVVYIEPEHDITDILTKLKQAENKVVALVPPKKASVLRSAVNVKLIAKAAHDAEKVVVLVTADPSIIKLAAVTRMPVAKTLQSRPEIPTAEDVAASMQKEQVIEEDLSSKNEPADNKADKSKKPESADKKSADKSKEDKSDKDPKDKDAKNKSKKTKIPSLDKYRKFILIGGVAFILIVGFLVWAFVFAPAVKIDVSVKTEPNNFSETVTFTTKDTEEKLEEGKFLLEERKTEKKSTVQFQATGTKDKGNKASGSLVAYAYFRNAGSYSIPSGATFSYGGMIYSATSAASLSWDGNDDSCESGSSISAGCLKTTNVSVTAAEPGTQYNIGAQSSGWSSNVGGVSVYNTNAISGGTSDVVSIVTQSDVDKAKSGIESSDDESAKNELKSTFGNEFIAIDSSFKQTIGDAVASPGVGEEVGSGVTPSLSVTTTLTIYAVDKTHVNQYIEAKSNLADDQKVYSVGEPYFDRFVNGDTGYAAKLKTTTQVGPKITNEEILEKAKGHKIGEVQSLLKSINGVKDVNIKGSFFWVNSVPNDPNKISVNLNVEGQQ